MCIRDRNTCLDELRRGKRRKASSLDERIDEMCIRDRIRIHPADVEDYAHDVTEAATTGRPVESRYRVSRDGATWVPCRLRLLRIAEEAKGAVVLAVSYTHLDVYKRQFAVMGEVGLAGEVRAVPQAERRLNECLRLGFRNVVLPKGNLRGMRVPEGVQVYPADTVLDAIAALDLFDRS